MALDQSALLELLESMKAADAGELMRRLLAAMRREGEEAELAPQPGLDDLRTLVADVGRAGLPVELHVEGETVPLPRAIDLSAYRIVQEGLTNALKYARASRAGTGCKPIAVPPGSRHEVTLSPAAARSPSNRRWCDDFPDPSNPSRTMNLP